MTLQITQYVVTAVALTAFGVMLLLLSAPWLYGKLRRCGLFFVFIAAGFLYSMATKPPTCRVYYDGGIKPGATANVVTNDTVSIHWQRDTSGGVYVPETATVYIDYRPNTETNAEWGLLAQTTVGAWGWSGTVENATNYDYNVWAYYIPPEPVHTNGVWTYKTHFDRRGKYALPLRARVEVNGVAIATPAEKRKDAERVTAKSYIQDGLVAMWDGIENAGWGIHDPNATTWKDLTGNGRDLPLSTATLEILSDGVRRKSTGTPSTASKVGWINTPSRTLEMCVTAPSSISSGSQVLLATTSVGSGTVVPCLVKKSVGYFEWSQQWNSSKIIFKSNITLTLSSSYNYGNTAKGYVNGEVQAVNNTDTWGFTADTISVLGDPRGTNYAPFEYCAHNVRIYSRALSAEEIQHNYKIDKERFNLP